MDNPHSPVLAFLDRQKVSRFMQTPAEYGRPWFGQLMAGPQLMAYIIQVNYWMEKYKLRL
jgi:asparagine synthase (glutamine-hydrolysing)